MIKKTLIFILTLLILSTAICEPEYYPFTKEEVLKINEKLATLTRNDSIKTKIIEKQKEQITSLNKIIFLDSLEISLQENKVKILEDKVNVKWYNNKYLWFFYGAIMIVASSFIVKNIK